MAYLGAEVLGHFLRSKRARLLCLAEAELVQRLPDRLGDVVMRLLAVLTEVISRGTLSGLVQASHQSVVDKNVQVGDCMALPHQRTARM